MPDYDNPQGSPYYPGDVNPSLAKQATAKARVKPGIKFEPLWDYVLIDPIAKHKTEGGVLLPEGQSADDTARSVVVAIGPGAYRTDSDTFVPVPLELGDIVFNMVRMQPFKVKQDGHLYLCVSCRDLIGVERKQW